jgi:hypothetical protein
MVDNNRRTRRYTCLQAMLSGSGDDKNNPFAEFETSINEREDTYNG